jgi:hypothetical protein
VHRWALLLQIFCTGVTSLLVDTTSLLSMRLLVVVGITLEGVAAGGGSFLPKATPTLLATLWMNDPPPVLVEVRVLGLEEDSRLAPETLLVLLPEEKEVLLLLVVAWVSVVGLVLILLAFPEEDG